MHVGEWMEPTARRSWIAALILGLVAAAPTAAAELAVSQAGPIGEVATLAEAGEVRVTFSEPMVALGRIPEPVRVPYFSISPDAAGSFRWSGTRTLIFKPASPLPYATRYEVTIGPGTSLDGSRLPGPYTFSFTTPTLRLLEASWYRPSGRHDGPLVAVLRFNQPVSREGVGPHLGLRYEPHEWAAPILAPEAIQRLGEVDPQAPADFQAKVERTLAAASSREGLVFEWAARWDTERDPPSPDMLVIRTQGPAPPTDAWVRVRIGPKARGVQGTEPAGKAQHEVLKLEPTFFVDGFRCAAACDPDGYNPLRLRSRVEVGAASRAIEVDDVTDAGRTAPVARRQSGREGEEGGEAGGDGPGWEYDDSTAVSLEDAGYSLHPARRYEVTVGRDLTSRDGQTLGHTWLGFVDNWHRRAFSSFGSGHGVWESRGGAQIPFHARNLRSVTQWIAPLKVDDLVPALRRLQAGAFALAPHEAGEERGLAPVPDAIQSYGLDLRAFLAREGAGLFWAALRDGDPIPRAHASAGGERPRSTLLQITNLGISVKDSPQNTLVLVTRLDGGGPVEGARVAIRDLDNAVRWTGVTDASGVALAPSLELRRAGRWWDLSFVITAEKDGDVSYVASDWNQGAEPWEFGLSFDLEQAKPVLRGTVFTDRGVYRLGEEVRAKVVLRSDTARGMALLAGSEAQVGMRDSRGEERDTRRIALNEWSSAEWSFRVPEDAPLGRYVVSATVGEQEQAVSGSFLVAAYRRPDFRVDANLGGETSMAGVRLKGVVAGRYLFGAPMGGKAVRWRYHRSPLFQVPPAVAERFPEARYAFLDRESAALRGAEDLQGREARLGDDGQLVLDLETDAAAGVPYRYTLEGVLLNAVTGGPWSVRGPADFTASALGAFVVDDRREAVYFTGLEKSPRERHLYRVGLDGTGLARLSAEAGSHHVTWSPDRRHYLDDFSSRSVPPSLTLRDAEGSARLVLAPPRTEVLAPFGLRPPKPLSIPAADGFPLPAEILEPAGFDPKRRYPLIVHVYGEPNAPLVVDAWDSRRYFDQVLLDRGYLVARVDPRSATGSGKAAQATVLRRKNGDVELGDLVAAVRWLKSRPGVDPDRVGIWGWSGGGTYTLLGLTRSREFKAGIAVAPETERRYYDTKYVEAYMKTPAENPEGYDEVSLVKRAGDLHGRLLLVFGTGDDNVHPQNSLHFADALIAAGKPFDMMAYPMRKHGIEDPPARRHLFEKMLEFWDRHL